MKKKGDQKQKPEQLQSSVDEMIDFADNDKDGKVERCPRELWTRHPHPPPPPSLRTRLTRPRSHSSLPATLLPPARAQISFSEFKKILLYQKPVGGTSPEPVRRPSPQGYRSPDHKRRSIVHGMPASPLARQESVRQAELASA